MKRVMLALGCALFFASPAAAETLTNATVIQLVQAGIGNDAVIAKIKATDGKYGLGTDDLIALKTAGVPGDVIAASDMSFLDPASLTRAVTVEPPSGERQTLHEARDQFERDLILRTLAEQQGNMSRTAEVLGVERSNLYRKMKAFGIAPSRRLEGEEEAV